jgi:hypothetical protein
MAGHGHLRGHDLLRFLLVFGLDAQDIFYLLHQQLVLLLVNLPLAVLIDSFSELLQDRVGALQFLLRFVFGGNALLLLPDFLDFFVFFSNLVLEVVALRFEVADLNSQVGLHMAIVNGNRFLRYYGIEVVVVSLGEKVVWLLASFQNHGLALDLVFHIVHIV